VSPIPFVLLRNIIESLDASLVRLGTDHVDLLQAHRFDYATPLDETLRAFDDLVRMGKVHYIGVSEWKASEIDQALVIAKEMGLDRIVSSQPQYSLLWRVIEEEVVPTCEANGISQIVWSPLAQGVLSGKYLPGGAIPEGSRGASKDANMVSRFLTEETLTAVAAYVALCDEAGLRPTQVALAWVLRNKNVASAIVGATRPEQIADNVGALDITLEDDFVAAIEAVLAPVAKFDPALTISPPERV
jgi:aryl-alcohol dehydrogenase-like predicted oxidoreductase